MLVLLTPIFVYLDKRAFEWHSANENRINPRLVQVAAGWYVA